MRRVLAVLVLAALAGCGESEPGAAPDPRASTEPVKYPVAYHAGEIMADWLDILRRSLDVAGDGRVVVIPVED